jgi:probable DNA metabolism protein
MSLGTWSFDGSLEELFALAHRAYREGSAPQAILNAGAVAGRGASSGELFSLAELDPCLGGESVAQPLIPSLRGEEAGRELRAFSGELFDMIIRIWMSEEALELPLLQVCAQAGLHGTEVLADYGSADLRAVSRASRRVSREIDRLSGLARFFPAGGLFLALLEPDSNIVAALMPHFARRFGREDFALVDLRRSLACARRGGAFESAAGEAALAFLPESSGEGDEDLLLWKRYFKATENPARRNGELQRRLMPRRYWPYLPELSD